MPKPKWPKKHYKVVKIPLYGGWVYCFKDREGFEKATEYLNIDAPHHGTDGLSLHLEPHESGKTMYLMGVFDGELSTLTHEVGHITHFITNHAGFDSGVGNGEPYCYLLGHIFRKLEKWIAKKEND